jgi:hypothetical protein
MAFGYERGDPPLLLSYRHTVIPYLAPAPAPEIKVGTVLRTVYYLTTYISLVLLALGSCMLPR